MHLLNKLYSPSWPSASILEFLIHYLVNGCPPTEKITRITTLQINKQFDKIA